MGKEGRSEEMAAPSHEWPHKMERSGGSAAGSLASPHSHCCREICERGVTGHPRLCQAQGHAGS